MAQSSLVIDGRQVPVMLKPNARAKRIILRMTPDQTGVVLTLPRHVRPEKAMEFAASQSGWIWQHLEAAPEKIPFESGSIIPLRGIRHRITPVGKSRGPVVQWMPDHGMPELRVAGDPAHHSRRILDWLKARARQDLSAASAAYAGKMGVRYKRIAIRDQDTRWGSCSATGTISYSWRLILAPSEILDYVAAHEIAHLVEMNHSPAFWALVEKHCPQTEMARRWLKTKGRDLKRYG